MSSISRRSLEIRRWMPPPVGLELGLTGTTGADAATTRAAATAGAAALAGQRLAPAAQAGQEVAQLGQLDLRLALLGAGVLGEDVEDQRGPVDDLDLELLLELAQLPGRELAVGDDGVGAGGLHGLAELGDLAGAHERARVGVLAALDEAVEDLGACGLGQAGQLHERRLGLPRGALGPHADEHHALEAQLPVLDLGDVGELGGRPGEPRDAPEGRALLEIERTSGGLLGERVGPRVRIPGVERGCRWRGRDGRPGRGATSMRGGPAVRVLSCCDPWFHDRQRENHRALRPSRARGHPRCRERRARRGR